MCAYSYCPVNRAQARAAFMGFVLGEEERHKKVKITVPVQNCAKRSI